MFPRIDDSSEYASIAYYRTVEVSTGQDRGTVFLLPNFARNADHRNVGKVAIKMLPEEILLETFAFYMCEAHNDDEWETLVHVCRRWRSIVFAAPRRLNLKLVCTMGTPVSKMSDIWPPLPIAVRVRGKFESNDDNVFAAFDLHDQICKIHIDNVFYGELKEVVGEMEVTFPALTDLYIRSPRSIYAHEGTPSFSESFLGGSAPNLRSLRLVNIAFPALPKLLLSSPGLVSLSLSDIPHFGYIPSDEMADCLSSLTQLKYLQIDFYFYLLRSGQESPRQPPLTRTAFPVLGKLLKGVTEYLDQILAHIEAPLLHYVRIEFLDPPIVDISRISQCIGRTEIFEAFDQAYMYFHNFHFNVVLCSQKRATGDKKLTLSLSWYLRESRWKILETSLDSCDRFFEPFDFCGVEGSFLPSWEKKTGNTSWFHLVCFFTTIKYMYLSQGVAAHIAPALQELTGVERREVSPALRAIFVERLDSLGPVQDALGLFVAARQLLSGHPIDVQCWVKGESSADQDVGDGF